MSAGPYRGCGHQPTEHAGRCVLGMPVVGGRHGERVLGAGGGSCGGGEGGGRAQPAGHWDLRADRHREAVVTQHARDDTRGEVRRVVEETGTLPFGVHP